MEPEISQDGKVYRIFHAPGKTQGIRVYVNPVVQKVMEGIGKAVRVQVGDQSLCINVKSAEDFIKQNAKEQKFLEKELPKEPSEEAAYELTPDEITKFIKNKSKPQEHLKTIAMGTNFRIEIVQINIHNYLAGLACDTIFVDDLGRVFIYFDLSTWELKVRNYQDIPQEGKPYTYVITNSSPGSNVLSWVHFDPQETKISDVEQKLSILLDDFKNGMNIFLKHYGISGDNLNRRLQYQLFGDYRFITRTPLTPSQLETAYQMTNKERNLTEP